MIQINGTGIVVNGSTPIYGINGGPQDNITATGPTAGTITGYQSTIFGSTTATINFNGYENDTANSQTVDFAYPFNQSPTVGPNDTGLTISANKTGITINAPDNITLYSGNVLIFGI